MKKYLVFTLILGAMLGCFLSPVKKIFYNSVTKPIQSLCVFQTSELAIHLWGKPTPNSSCFIKQSILDNKIKKGLPIWAKQQIKEDLSSFEHISENDLDRTFNEHNTSYNALVRFKVKDGTVTRISNLPLEAALQEDEKNKTKTSRSNRNQYYSQLEKDLDPRSTAFLYVLEYLAHNGYIKNTDFILALNDYSIVNSKTPLPIFTFAKDLDTPIEKDFILIPDWQNLSSTTDMRQRIRNAKPKNPWENKLDIVFWRGGSNDSSGFRTKLVNFSKEKPQTVDAAFLGDMNTSFVAPEDHLKYKYLISIDGTRASWERLIWHLQSNSLVFKHQSNHIQWFYKGIAPNVHYIPVTDEQSIVKEMHWAETHPDEVQRIIHNATTFVEQNLEIEDLYHYILVLLQEYNKKLVY